MEQPTEEDLKNMTPEQIKELQKKNCIFCHIVSGKVQSKKLYEDESLVGILDINPANPGHILLIPKEHNTVMPQFNDVDVGHMFMVAKALSHVLLRSIKAEGTNIFVANGAVAGQKSPHFMIHIIPRKKNDNLTCFSIPHYKIGNSEQDKIFNLLKEGVNRQFGTGDAVLEEQGTPEQTQDVIKEHKKNVVEAEFNEKSEDKPKKKAAKKKSAERKSPKTSNDQSSSDKKSSGKEESGIDIDSIAKVLLGG